MFSTVMQNGMHGQMRSQIFLKFSLLWPTPTNKNCISDYLMQVLISSGTFFPSEISTRLEFMVTLTEIDD